MLAWLTHNITGITTLECSCQKPECLRVIYGSDGNIYLECTACGDKYLLTGD